MDSYYDTVIRQCETLMQEGSFKEAYQQLEEELSMPYIPKAAEEKIIALYNECRSTLRLSVQPSAVTKEIEELLKGSID